MRAVTLPRPRVLPPAALLGVAWLAALACTRPTPGYCGGDGGAANCKAPFVCSDRTLLCEMPDGGNGDRPDAPSGGDAKDARDGGDAADATPDVYKGCRGNQDCVTSDAGHACVVDGGACVACVIDDDCKDPTLPACTADHACVECVERADCKDPTRPICQGNQCRACMADSECPGDPGVCMNHGDGHCATSAETIVVQMKDGCVATATGANTSVGTSAMPVCSMQPLTQLIDAGRRLVVVRGTVQAASAALPAAGGGEISIVGQSSAVIAGGASPGLQVSGGQVYVRSVAFKSSTLAGIRATASMLRLDGVLVDNNTGGGVFVDASQFAVLNSTISNNGPAQEGTTVWGGMYVSNLPAGASKLLQRVSIQNNKGPGLICSGGITGSGVLAVGNSTLEIGSGCMVTSCGAAPSATCGAP
jgi:hypothetical protein